MFGVSEKFQIKSRLVLVLVHESKELSLGNKTSLHSCSEDDLRSRIFGTFVVKFLACLPLLIFSNI